MAKPSNRRRNILVLTLILVAGVIVGLITFNLDRIMRAVWEFRDGFMGIPPKRR